MTSQCTPGALRAAYEIMSNRRLPLFKHEAEEIAELIDRETAGQSQDQARITELEAALQGLLDLAHAYRACIQLSDAKHLLADKSPRLIRAQEALSK